MTRRENFLKSVTKLMLTAIFMGMIFQCSDEELTLTPQTSLTDSSTSSTVTTTATAVTCSSCKYVVPANVSVVDGKLLGIKPGDMICFNAATKYTNPLTFKNIVGTADNPVIITNCGGTVNLTVVGKPYNFKVSNSKYFRITGGNTANSYGIRISGSTANGLTLCDFSTNFEVDHIEVLKVGFAGIMAKTDPTCDINTTRGYFTMRDVSIHDNYVHDTKGEGFYIGHSFYEGYNTACGVKLPHTIEGIKLFNNKAKSTGWDGIQLSCATKGAEVYSNIVENAGVENKSSQNYGIILGGGTGGVCHSNYIKGGTGTGMAVFGLADNVVHDNIIVNPGAMGIFCDERTVPGAGYKFINNTIINPKTEGMRIYAELVPLNVVVNNIIVNPGSYGTYGASSYIMKLNKVLNLQSSNNYTTRNIADVKFANAAGFNFRLTSASPAVNKGKSISTYNILKDYYKQSRLKGSAYDIGASEY